MDDIVINIKNLGKRYNIGSVTDKGRTFREALTDKIVTPLRLIIPVSSILSGLIEFAIRIKRDGNHKSPTR